MSIVYREDREKWQATVWIAGKRKRLLFLSKREAAEFARSHRLGRVGLREDGETESISENFNYYAETESIRKNPISQLNDKRYLNLAFHYLTTERKLSSIGEITLQDLEGLQRWLKSAQKCGDDEKPAWSAATVNRCFHTLKHLFSKNMSWRKIKDDPSRFLRNLPEPESNRRPLSSSDFDQVVRAAPAWFLPCLFFMRSTGARPSSIASLTWGDIDFAQSRINFISRKGAEGRAKVITTPLVQSTAEILLRLRNARRFARPSDPVFETEAGRPLSAELISKVGNRAIRRAGLEGVVLYGLRHALAADMTAAGIATELVRQALGHASIRTTQNYAKGVNLTVVGSALEAVRGVVVPPTATKENGSLALGGCPEEGVRTK